MRADVTTNRFLSHEDSSQQTSLCSKVPFRLCYEPAYLGLRYAESLHLFISLKLLSWCRHGPEGVGEGVSTRLELLVALRGSVVDWNTRLM
jgi:hypothetical protein